MPDISQEDFDLFQKYKQLGEVETLETTLAEKQKLDRSQFIGQVAASTGFKASVLERLSNGLELEEREGQYFVGDASLEDYANENWQDFLPALKGTSTESKKVPFVSQPIKPATTNKLKNVGQSYVNRTYAQPKQQAA